MIPKKQINKKNIKKKDQKWQDQKRLLLSWLNSISFIELA